MTRLDTTVDADVMTLWLDTPDETHNTLAAPMLEQLNTILTRAEADATIRGLVIASRKPHSFIVGADIREFSRVDSPEALKTQLDQGHALFQRLESYAKPVVAAVHGPCLGGGLELILCCSYRIATAHPKTVFGLPEVRLGLLPGLGGTQRLRRLIGLDQALPLILTGKSLYAKPAKRLGLIDALTHPAGLVSNAQQAALALADNSVKRRPPKTNPAQRAMRSRLGRPMVYRQANKQIAKNSQGHYPAPYAILEALKTGCEQGDAAGFQAEREGFATLLFTPESAALRHLFFAQRVAQRNPFSHAHPLTQLITVGVLGAGLMGSGIAQVSAANAGYDVILKDRQRTQAAGGLKRIYKDLSKRLGRGMRQFELDQTLSQISLADSYAPFNHATITIEAVLEALPLKQQVLKDVEAHTSPEHIFASNTSSIPIADIAEVSERPENVLGMHYFSPVPKMPLLEIVRTEKTSEHALAVATDVGLKQGKTVIVVKDSPGFFTTRVLAIYLSEALALLAEGARVEEIDSAMHMWGFPVGPLKLLDEVGIDVGAKINGVLAPFVKDRLAPMDISPLVEAGYVGKKAKRGFYRYQTASSRKRAKSGREVDTSVYAFFTDKRRSFTPQEIQERLSLMFLAECVRCLEEGVISSARDGDIGAVFGLGYPPFRGGPFWQMDQEGLLTVLTRLETLEAKHGIRFAPPAKLRELVAAEATFYPSQPGIT